MNAFEIITLIGEFVSTEIDGVDSVEYAKEQNGDPTAFTVQMESGKRYSVEIKENV